MLHRASRATVVLLSLIALACVVSGYFQPPQRDEGAAAHLFQLAVAAWVPCGIVMTGTAGARGIRRAIAPAATSAILMAIAFGALYVLEHHV
jgi:hypothetical protein